MKRLTLALLPALAASPALAHLSPGEHGSFATGITHPLLGGDHILAMLGVGLWATVLGRNALWRLPLAFVGAMAAGFLLALSGTALPFVEPAILASVLILGVLVALCVRLPANGATLVVAAFGLFHGYAHGAELGGATPWSYLAGFALASMALHLVGLAIGVAMTRFSTSAATRGAGGLIALMGAWITLS